MTLFIDSHCHLDMLDLSAYQQDLDALVKKAKEVGVQKILTVGVDLEHAKEVIAIAERYDHVYASVGLHPSDKIQSEPEIADYLIHAEHPEVVAIGETGLDYYYNDSGLDIMRDRFRRQIQVAKQLNKPLIIHSRSAREDTIRIMQEEDAKAVGGVMHCFTESWEMAQQAMALGFYISFSGIITFKNAAEVAEVAKRVPIEKMLIETDAPYLAPVPYRGKQNEPQYVRFVADKIAELKQISVEEVAEQTSANFLKLFGVNPEEV